jgi:branched-chain amino acid transport system permease protein
MTGLKVGVIAGPPRSQRRVIGLPLWHLAGIGAFVVLALVAGFATGIQWQASIILALLACLGALGLNLLMGTAGQVSIGSAGLLAVGSFSTVWFLSVGIPFPLDVVCAALASGLVGLIIGFPALRLRGLYLAIATLAGSFIILFVAQQYQNAKAGPGGFTVNPVLPGTLAQSQQLWLIIMVIIVVLALLLVGLLTTGRTGRTWRMIRDHENVAPTFGINVTRWKLSAFVISSMIFGVEGSLFAHFLGVVSTDSFTFGVAITYVAMVVIGGLDTLAGAVVGAVLIALLPTVVPDMLSAIAGSASPSVAANVSTIIYGALILVFVVFIPRGIVGAVGSLFSRRPRDGRVVAKDTAKSSV